MILKRTKGQAMTEFVLMLPLFIIIFASLMQFFILMSHYMVLAYVERAVMRYMTAPGEEITADKVRAFAAELAGKCGLKRGYLSCQITPVGCGSLKDIDPFGLLRGFAGVKIELSYKEKLFPAFAAITGRENIELKTKIYSAAGPALQFKIKEKAGQLWNMLTQNH